MDRLLSGPKIIADPEKMFPGINLGRRGLQNEIAPEQLLNRYEKRFEKTRKKIRKNDPKRV